MSLLVAWLVVAACASASAHAPPDISNISVSIPCDACADPTPFLALVVVSTHVGNREQRDVLRAAYPAAEIAALGFRRVFVVGKLLNGTETQSRYKNVTEAEVTAESQLNGDMLQLNMTEGYRRLIWKMYKAYTWTIDNCAHATFIIHNDDDLFMDYYSTARMLRSLHGDDADVIRGTHVYNSFIVGPYYSTTMKSLKLIVEAAATTEPNEQLDDDVFFTLFAADAAGVKRVQVDEVGAWKGTARCCVGNGNVYECQFFAFDWRPPFSHERALMFKMHGQSCYRGGCLPYDTALLETEGVTCFN